MVTLFELHPLFKIGESVNKIKTLFHNYEEILIEGKPHSPYFNETLIELKSFYTNRIFLFERLIE